VGWALGMGVVAAVEVVTVVVGAPVVAVLAVARQVGGVKGPAALAVAILAVGVRALAAPDSEEVAVVAKVDVAMAMAMVARDVVMVALVTVLAKRAGVWGVGAYSIRDVECVAALQRTLSPLRQDDIEARACTFLVKSAAVAAMKAFEMVLPQAPAQLQTLGCRWIRRTWRHMVP